MAWEHLREKKKKWGDVAFTPSYPKRKQAFTRIPFKLACIDHISITILSTHHSNGQINKLRARKPTQIIVNHLYNNVRESYDNWRMRVCMRPFYDGSALRTEV